MRHILTAVVLASAVTLATGCASSPPPPVSEQVQEYYEKNASLPKPSAAATKASGRVAVKPSGESLRVLFAGDSLTVGRDASTPERSFRSLMVANLEKSGPVEAATIGKSGRMVSEVEPEISGDAGGHDLLVVELGTNDVYKSTPDAFSVDYPKFLDAVRKESPKAALVCAGVWKSGSPAGLSIDQVIEVECEQRGGRFVPLAAYYADPANQSKPGVTHWDGGVTDGNHPNDAGHRKIADALLSLVTVR